MLFETKTGCVVIEGILLLELIQRRKEKGRRSDIGEQVPFACIIFNYGINPGSPIHEIHYKEKYGGYCFDNWYLVAETMG